MNIKTIGGVIESGRILAEIVPLEGILIVETQIQLRDIGHIRTGLPVKVKIGSYDYARYGAINGELIYISATKFVKADGKLTVLAILNAVEHGNLSISYEDKTALLLSGGWREEVDKRAQLPENIKKRVEIDFVKEGNKYVIKISDQGSGFIALGATLESLTVSFIIRKFIGFPSSLSHWRDALILFLGAGLIRAIPSPTIGITMFYFKGYIASSEYWYSWCSWWIGNSLGIIAITPVLVTLFSPKKYISNKRKIYIATPLLVMLTLIAVIFTSTSEYEVKKLQQNLDMEARNATIRFEYQIAVKIQEIESVKNFFNAS